MNINDNYEAQLYNSKKIGINLKNIYVYLCTQKNGNKN